MTGLRQSRLGPFALLRSSTSERMTMPNFITGQTVRANTTSRSDGITKDKDYTILVAGPTLVRIENDRGVKRWLNPSQFDAPYVAPKAEPVPAGKRWIIALIEGGILKPAKEPRQYSSEKQAHAVAKEMAERHRGNVFVVFEATGFTFVPASTETVVHAL